MWNYFTAVNENIANCEVCRKSIRYCGNTTNLHKHIKQHEKENSELQKKRREEEANPSDRPPAVPALRQRSLAESFQRGNEYPGRYSGEINILVI